MEFTLVAAVTELSLLVASDEGLEPLVMSGAMGL